MKVTRIMANVATGDLGKAREALEQALPVVLVALSFTCLVLLLATQLFYGRIQHRWAGEEFD